MKTIHLRPLLISKHYHRYFARIIHQRFNITLHARYYISISWQNVDLYHIETVCDLPAQQKKEKRITIRC